MQPRLKRRLTLLDALVVDRRDCLGIARLGCSNRYRDCRV
jgi:hypothetical protein